MKQYLKVAFSLFLICAVAASLLAVINAITAPVIAQNSEKETIEAYNAIAAGYTFDLDELKESDTAGVEYTIPLYDGNELAGYIAGLVGNGYGGAFTLVASYSIDGTLLEAKMMGNSETPGLGKKAEESWYMKQFAGLGGDKPLPESKSDLADPSAVSGASVTFNGVNKAIKTGSEMIKQMGGR